MLRCSHPCRRWTSHTSRGILGRVPYTTNPLVAERQLLLLDTISKYSFLPWARSVAWQCAQIHLWTSCSNYTDQGSSSNGFCLSVASTPVQPSVSVVHSHSIRLQDMSQVPHLLLEQLPLVGVQFEVTSSQPLKQLLQAVELLLGRPADNDHIIEIHQAGFVSKVP
jgi:hypothetical protein